MNITEPQSHAALDRLMRSGRVTEEDVSFALAEARTDIEMRLAHLRRFDGVATVAASITSAPVAKNAAPAKRGKSPVSAEQAQSRKTQGIYLGLIRHTPKTKRAKYQAIAKASGREAAIEAMRAAKG